MDWSDEGIVLSARPHGETDAVVSALTFEHGRHLGLVKGGIGRRTRPWLQPGNRLSLTWRARLSEHLGNYRVEPVQLFGSRLVSRPLGLLGLGSATALVEETAAEREPHPRLYAGLLQLLTAILAAPDDGAGAGAAGAAAWLETYVRFELLLLADLGFALALERCAVTGGEDDLRYVSPRTGRAVSTAAAGDLAPRLLPLPGFLRGEAATPAAVLDGLRLSGHFLARTLLAPADRPLPAARDHLLARLATTEND